MRLQFLTAMLLLGGSVVAQEKVPDPEIERQAFKVADGFEVTLFAADPAIAKPIGMNFDSAGRLWVTSSTLYPQIKPGEVANDKIIMLEDKDGDGRAEAGKIFAEGLYIPTGVEFGDGGVYVGASTELLHFKDTDGDGKADVRKVVLSGFGTEDTHHTVHTLRWGPDGQLYFNQSIYIHSHIETPWGPRRLSGSGTWRLRPRSMELEVLTRGLVNPWGHTWDRFGQEFATDGAGSDGVSIYIPGAAYGSWGTDAKRWIGGVNPGSPKYCGAEIVSGRHLPEDWQGSLITNDFRANRVVRFVLREEGAGYTAKLMSDVIKSSDKAFRPVDVKMGPDGAIYIADWYNPVINHGEVDFRSPMRDHTHGRIWRLTAKSRPLLQRPKIAGAPISELLEMLKAPEQWTRHMARRELYERDAKEVAAALGTWVKNIGGSDPQSEHQRLEALWTYETIDVVEPNLLASLLKADDPHIRAAATHALHFWGKRVPNGIDLLGAAVADENPQVRLNAVISLGQIPSLRSIELAMSALDRPMDRWIDYGLYLTINKLKDTWLPAVSSGQFTFNDNPRHLAVALQALESSEAVAPLLVLLKRGTIQPERAAGMIGVIASSGGPQELAELWDYLLRSKDSKVLVAGMGALLGSARDR
ncbi:MAG TPA: PVC-type heme-binding CxxCH protein, partial [Tepidisphaeraceae bacterium]|nr:PVC-type heme-binding CxxCH protein [Tepidisphaeraceae bacterium]